MKDNKGFTLVELLAVIVILALIIAIAVPAVAGSLNKAKSKLSDYDKELLLDAAKFYITDVDNNKLSIDIDGESYQGYEFKKKMNEKGSIIVTAYTLTQNKYYNPGCDYDTSSSCKVDQNCEIKVNMELDEENGYLVTKRITSELGSNC